MALHVLKQHTPRVGPVEQAVVIAWKKPDCGPRAAESAWHPTSPAAGFSVKSFRALGCRVFRFFAGCRVSGLGF